MEKTRVNGLHHITAIAGAAQENLDFYAGVLGMRLVKRSVNQDDPGTYHLFYADAEGHPGSDLTFFSVDAPRTAAPRARARCGSEPGSARGQPRVLGGAAAEVRHVASADRVALRRRGAPLLRPSRSARRARGERSALAPRFTPFDGSSVPPERQVRWLYGAQLWEREGLLTSTFLTAVLGFERLGAENGWTRYGFPDAAGVVDLRETPDERRGAWGVGSVHHLAWRVDDEQHQLSVQRRVASVGARPTEVIDRFWFMSVYFREPGGVRFEVATDGPGFATDEDPAHLGEQLALPPWLEAHRGSIETALPPLTMPIPAATLAGV